MDDILNRALFRNRARHYEQLKTNNIGKHVIGALAQIPRVYQATKSGLAAFRAAQAARGQMPIVKYIAENPKKIGALETALGGQQLYEGSKDVYEGITKDNPSKVAEGGANLLFGKSFAKSGIGRYKTGQPSVGSWTQELIAPLGLMGASYALPDGTVAENIAAAEQQLGRKLTKTEKEQATQFIKDKIRGVSKRETTEVTPGTAGDPRGETYYSPMGDIAYSAAPISSLEKSFGDMSNADIIAGKKPIGGGTPMGGGEPTGGGGTPPPNKPNLGGALDNAATVAQKQVADLKDSSTREIPNDYTLNKLGNKILANEKAGADLVKEATKLSDKGDPDATAFKKFYKDFQGMTEGGTEMSDLVMLKLASGLLAGTTTQRGFAGFAEVLGKAGESTIDTAIKLAAMEKEKKSELALAYLKNKSLNGAAGISQDRNYYLEKDPTAIGGQKLVERARFAEGPLKGYDAVATPVIDPNTGIAMPTWVPAPYNPNAIEIKREPGLIDERTAQLHSLATSYKMANVIANEIPLELLGTPGKIKLIKEATFGTIESAFRSEFMPGDYNGDVNDYINKVVLKGDSDLIAKKEKEVADYINMGSQTKFYNAKPTEEELSKLTRAARIEVNIKYAYANGLKDKDRLTEKNLEDAAKVTSVFGFFNSPRGVKERFKQLAEDSAIRFEAEIPRFQQVGGQNYYLENSFSYMPAIAKYKSVQQQIKEKQVVQSKIKPIVDSIPGYN
jgi:hypothetical protein